MKIFSLRNLTASSLVVKALVEISEKVQKSLITLISNRLHRLEIRERKVVFQSSFMKPKAWLRLCESLDTLIFVRIIFYESSELKLRRQSWVN